MLRAPDHGPQPIAQCGFDAASDRYDADEHGNGVLAHLRERIFAQLCRTFAPGSRLIELGSGTGIEATRLVAERGCRVALVDVAPRMLARAAASVRSADPEGLLGAHLVPARSVGRLVAVHGCSSFDGVYSSLGPLNCEPRLEPVAEGLVELVRPGGALVLSVINRWCPAEVAWFAAHGQWREATRRWGGPVQAASYPGGPKDVKTWYYSRRAIARAFAPAFCVEHAEALPLLWPPPYLDFLVARRRRLFATLLLIERWTATRPLLRDLGDHTLLRLRRR
ncbi:MAG: class I SAM-dependent methyltransferase [Myxococcota bacterium]|nr:class I SAM-dependent methyltransferase [Myxococcota bacterium]